MINKKLMHYLQLCFVFTAVVVLTLLYNWGYRNSDESHMSMMGQSMGNMMASMHMKDINISTLIRQEEQSESMTGMEQHHDTQSTFIKTGYSMTTYIIVLLLPFIIAGSVFLAIIWIK